jgi:hypothetical protein
MMYKSSLRKARWKKSLQDDTPRREVTWIDAVVRPWAAGPKLSPKNCAREWRMSMWVSNHMGLTSEPTKLQSPYSSSFWKFSYLSTHSIKTSKISPVSPHHYL